jgi:hypothetical protein
VSCYGVRTRISICSAHALQCINLVENDALVGSNRGQNITAGVCAQGGGGTRVLGRLCYLVATSVHLDCSFTRGENNLGASPQRIGDRGTDSQLTLELVCLNRVERRFTAETTQGSLAALHIE